ncbi:hypothetical protein C7I85_28340 [Mesorhizobium soli]|uniref:Uncharacterized protein n=2 Tax=Pseudaminobacter soli (ex Li et al. 2025) TaxID=1295366 RepID=A0A2P7RSL5_9HYPH|nr:hypothetical protein C7I85_28340 [Mesorhizobium soli]
MVSEMSGVLFQSGDITITSAGLVVGANIHEIIGLIAFVALLLVANNVPEKRTLTLKTSSGDVTALSSHDANLVESVHRAIENAFPR